MAARLSTLVPLPSPHLHSLGGFGAIQGFSPRNLFYSRTRDILFNVQMTKWVWNYLSFYHFCFVWEPWPGQQILTLRTPIKSAQSQAQVEFFVHKTNFCHFSEHNMRILVLESAGCRVWPGWVNLICVGPVWLDYWTHDISLPPSLPPSPSPQTISI